MGQAKVVHSVLQSLHNALCNVVYNYLFDGLPPFVSFHVNN